MSSFVTATDLKFVNKNAEFKVFLGKDETIKVKISPQISQKEQTKGSLITSKVNKETFSRRVRVENTRDEDVNILLLEQIPLARDKKIKVDILSPNFAKQKSRESYKINHMNNLEVKRLIKKGNGWKFNFKYRVEWPKDTELVYSQSLENLAR